MARSNSARKVESVLTHQGGRAAHINAEQKLRRTVMACMLWEKGFYEDGETVTQRITDLVPQLPLQTVAQIAVAARNDMHLRHAPLFITAAMAIANSQMVKAAPHKASSIVAETIYQVIQRPDDITELISLYWELGNKRLPLTNQIKKGVARAFCKFDDYQLAKYSRGSSHRNRQIRLKDAMFLCHPRAVDAVMQRRFKALADDEFTPPDTWEVGISAAKSADDKRREWTRLINEKRLGGLALLRNLRNMEKAGVVQMDITRAIDNGKFRRVLPFRFIAAARHAPAFEAPLEAAMLHTLREEKRLGGRTILLIDVSGSMKDNLSGKSDLNRLDAACGLAILLREICDAVSIYTFSWDLVQIPGRHGFALSDAIKNSQEMAGTSLSEAIDMLYADRNKHVETIDRDRQAHFKRHYPNIGNCIMHGQALSADRLIVITDEQSESLYAPKPYHDKSYMINVANNQNGVGYGYWTHIDGFSEAIVRYIQEFEASRHAVPD